MISILPISKPKKTWRRMIAMVELAAFPTEIEQMDNPSLQGRPICLVNSEQGSIVIAASSEAQASGIQIGMTWLMAKEHCPESVRVVARPARYGEISRQIMAALRAFTPEVEVFASNEAFLDLTSCQSYYRHEPDVIGRLIKETVNAASSGLPCSIGISGDKTSARWAAKQQQGGLTVLHPNDAEDCLRSIPLAELCGMGRSMVAFFAQYDVHCCGDMKKIPVSVPAQRYGNLGRQLWLMAQARDPSPVNVRCMASTSLSKGKILLPQTCDLSILQSHFMLTAEKLALQLRRQGQSVADFNIGIRCPEGWRQAWLRPPEPTNNSLEIFRLSKQFLRQYWFGDTVQQIRIQAAPPVLEELQPDFFA